MTVRTPCSIRSLHEELLSELSVIQKNRGKAGLAAAELKALLKEHCSKEEEYGLPSLSIIASLAEDRITENVLDAVNKSEWLDKNLHAMLNDHMKILSALKKLVRYSTGEKKEACIKLSGKLMLHIQNEEEVLYPAAVLTGKYIKQLINSSDKQELVIKDEAEVLDDVIL